MTSLQALKGGQVVTLAFDLWSLGCIIYQMLEGKPPFRAGSEYLTFEKILALDYSFHGHMPEAAENIIEQLLQKEPSKRIGQSKAP